MEKAPTFPPSALLQQVKAASLLCPALGLSGRGDRFAWGSNSKSSQGAGSALGLLGFVIAGRVGNLAAALTKTRAR